MSRDRRDRKQREEEARREAEKILKLREAEEKKLAAAEKRQQQQQEKRKAAEESYAANGGKKPRAQVKRLCGGGCVYKRDYNAEAPEMQMQWVGCRVKGCRMIFCPEDDCQGNRGTHEAVFHS